MKQLLNFLIPLLIAFHLIISVGDIQGQTPELDLELLKERFIAELLESPVDEQQIDDLIHTIREDGTWPGINYEDTTRTGFEHRIHLDNMVDLGRAYKKENSAFYGNNELKQVIWKALDFWLEHDFISENWWWNQIGTPERIGNLLLIMDENLTDEHKLKAGPIAGRANLDAWGARPGGDLIKIAGILGKYALFERDITVLNEAVEAITGEIGFAVDRGDPSDVRGLQTDFSFHHRHDRVTSTITYGQGFASYFVGWAEKVNGTVFDFPDETVELIVDFYLDGICRYLAFGKYPDPGGRNRGITRLGALDPRSPELPETLLRITNYRQNELEAIVQIRKGEREPDLRSNKFFWHTEYFSHQRPHYFTSVRMYSTRNHSVEVPYNSEGLKNHHLADGYTFITRTGEEYVHIFPVWDWQKIPGTTVVQKP
jgi:chondroitin AC lyase